jgi:dihydrofolate reductase
MKMIVAKDLNNAIGKNNQLPWKLSADLKNFKLLTTDNTILMGRKTFESIGNKPLPFRKNIVITRDKNNSLQNVEVVYNINEAMEIDKNLIVIGGSEIYNLCLPYISELYLTIVNTIIKDADTFFPSIDMYDWITKGHWTYKKDEKNQYDFCFYHLVKI